MSLVITDIRVYNSFALFLFIFGVFILFFCKFFVFLVVSLLYREFL